MQSYPLPHCQLMACARLGLGLKTPALLSGSCPAASALDRISSSARKQRLRATAMTRRRQAAASGDSAAAVAEAVADLLQRHEEGGTLPRCVVFDLDYTVSQGDPRC